jgi:hypothetical protein
MHRPLTQLPKKEEVRRPPASITEIAELERAEIWQEVRDQEEQFKALYE